MNPPRLIDAVYMWGAVLLGIIVFLILAGVPFWFWWGC